MNDLKSENKQSCVKCITHLPPPLFSIKNMIISVEIMIN